MRLDGMIGDNINYVKAFRVRCLKGKGGVYCHCVHEVDYYKIIRHTDGSIGELRSLTNNWNYYKFERVHLYIVECAEDITDFDKPIVYKLVNQY